MAFLILSLLLFEHCFLSLSVIFSECVLHVFFFGCFILSMCFHVPGVIHSLCTCFQSPIMMVTNKHVLESVLAQSSASWKSSFASASVSFVGEQTCMLCFNRLCLESCSYHSLTYRMVFDQGLSCCFIQNDCYFLVMSTISPA